MSKLTKVTFKLLDLIVIFVMMFSSPMSVLAQDAGPQLSTDKTDYVPGDTINVSGVGFVTGNYSLKATYPDGTIVDWGAVLVDDTLVFSATAPAAVTAEGTYGLATFAEGNATVVARPASL
jgi:hypothetical protein